MSASLTDSDSALLSAIWQLSLWLAALSLLILLALIVHRFWQERHTDKKIKRRSVLSKIIYAALAAPVEPSRETLPKLLPGDAAIVCRFALDMLRTVRGEERMRLVKMLELWKVGGYIHSLLRSPGRGKRIQALTLLGYFNDERSLKILLHHMKKSHSYVQLAAMHALAARHAVSNLPEILDALTASRQHNTLMLADIMARFDVPAAPYLIRVAINEYAAIEVRVAAMMALGNMGAVEAVEPLLTLMVNKNAEIRAQATVTLGKLGDERSAANIMAKLHDNEDAVRVQAAHAAGMFKSTAMIPSLMPLLDDENWWVRYRAAEALYALGDAGAALLKAAGQQSARAGDIAGQLLKEKGAAHG